MTVVSTTTLGVVSIHVRARLHATVSAADVLGVSILAETLEREARRFGAAAARLPPLGLRAGGAPDLRAGDRPVERRDQGPLGLIGRSSRPSD
jgi:hypothetical protein